MASTTKKRKTRQPTDKSILDTALTPGQPITNEGQLAGAIAEAVEGAEASTTVVTVGQMAITITHLPYGVERKWNKIIGPYLQFLIGAWLDGPEEFAKALSVAVAESDEDLTALALIILTAYNPDITEDWLNQHGTFEQVLELIKAQIEKNKVADTLGKLWGRGVLSAKLAEALSISSPPTTPASTQPSSASASATSSTPPSS